MEEFVLLPTLVEPVTRKSEFETIPDTTKAFRKLTWWHTPEENPKELV